MTRQLEFEFNAPAPRSLKPEAARRRAERVQRAIKWAKDHPKRRREILDKYYREHRADLLSKQLQWRSVNARRWKDISNRSQRRRYQRLKIDPTYRLKWAIRNRVRHAMTSQERTKLERTLKLVGCTVASLIQHLERQFEKGMTWENYGCRWHVDHRIACAQFDLGDPRQQRLCFHWSNLQPMFARQNIVKGKRITQEHQFPLLMD